MRKERGTFEAKHTSWLFRLAEIKYIYFFFKKVSDKESHFYKSLGIVESQMEVIHEQHMPLRGHNRQGWGNDKKKLIRYDIRHIINLIVEDSTYSDWEVQIYLMCKIITQISKF